MTKTAAKMTTEEVAQLYDRNIAAYDRDSLGLLGQARHRARDQLETQLRERPAAIDRCLDLALGTGESLLAMRDLFSDAELFGVDVSPQMLASACRKLDVDSVAMDARQACSYFPPAAHDLVLCHFLFAYVSPAEVLPVVARLCRPGGWVSILTTTYDDSFPALMRRTRDFVDGCGWRQAFERAVAHTPIPNNAAELRSALDVGGFDIVEESFAERDVVWPDLHALERFAFDEGWFVTGLQMGERRVLVQLAETGFAGMLPFHDRARILAVTARRR